MCLIDSKFFFLGSNCHFSIFLKNQQWSILIIVSAYMKVKLLPVLTCSRLTISKASFCFSASLNFTSVIWIIAPSMQCRILMSWEKYRNIHYITYIGIVYRTNLSLSDIQVCIEKLIFLVTFSWNLRRFYTNYMCYL